MKNFIVAIICALLVVGLGVSIYFNFDAIKAQATLYTKEQMDKAVEQAYAEGNKNEQQHLIQIATLQNQLEVAEAELENLDKLASENTEQKAQISELQTRILQLKAEIEYYQNLLEIENVENLVYITFNFNNEVIDTKIVESGSKIVGAIDTTKIDLAGYILNYWEDAEGEQVDLETKVFVSNAELYANITAKEPEKHSVVFSSNIEGMRIVTEKLEETDLFGFVVIYANGTRIDNNEKLSQIEEGTLVRVRIAIQPTMIEPIKITIGGETINIFAYENIADFVEDVDYFVYTASFVIDSDIQIVFEGDVGLNALPGDIWWGKN